MWRVLLETAIRLNVQVFATTHSWDCVESFAEGCVTSRLGPVVPLAVLLAHFVTAAPAAVCTRAVVTLLGNHVTRWHLIARHVRGFRSQLARVPHAHAFVGLDTFALLHEAVQGTSTALDTG